ncbi:MAG: phosphotransferase [Kiritimatiellia bacterium]
MNLPRKALILAAGLGTRLRPLTLWKPKPLLPVNGSPLIEQIIQRLENWGVRDIFINTHWMPGAFNDWLQNRPTTAAHISLSHEPDILGTGGALIPLKHHLGNEPFWLVNADILVDGLAPTPFVDGLDLASAWVIKSKGPCTVSVSNGIIQDFQAVGGATFCGWQLLTPDIYRYLPDSPVFCSIIDAYQKAIGEGRMVRAVEQDSAQWDDLGTLDSYTRSNPDAGIEDLGKRGSNRSFSRLTLAPNETAIAVEYDPIRRENCRYAPIARHLKQHGIAVPTLYADHPQLRTLVLEDLGCDTLEGRMRGEPEKAMEFYAPVIRLLAQLHTMPIPSPDLLEPPFSEALYAWEQRLFREHILSHSFSADEAEELKDLTRHLLTARPCPIHRDCQSANIHFRLDGTPCFIDFQGMRVGAAAYDLASLLYDPYVPPFSPSQRSRLLEIYQEVNTDDASVLQLLDYAAIERLLQATGAFGRLSSLGLDHYRALIPSTLEVLARLTSRLGYSALESLCTRMSKSFSR